MCRVLAFAIIVAFFAFNARAHLFEDGKLEAALACSVGYRGVGEVGIESWKMDSRGLISSTSQVMLRAQGLVALLNEGAQMIDADLVPREYFPFAQRFYNLNPTEKSLKLYFNGRIAIVRSAEQSSTPSTVVIDLEQKKIVLEFDVRIPDEAIFHDGRFLMSMDRDNFDFTFWDTLTGEAIAWDPGPIQKHSYRLFYRDAIFRKKYAQWPGTFSGGKGTLILSEDGTQGAKSILYQIAPQGFVTVTELVGGALPLSEWSPARESEDRATFGFKTYYDSGLQTLVSGGGKLHKDSPGDFGYASMNLTPVDFNALKTGESRTAIRLLGTRQPLEILGLADLQPIPDAIVDGRPVIAASHDDTEWRRLYLGTPENLEAYQKDYVLHHRKWLSLLKDSRTVLVSWQDIYNEFRSPDNDPVTHHFTRTPVEIVLLESHGKFILDGSFSTAGFVPGSPDLVFAADANRIAFFDISLEALRMHGKPSAETPNGLTAHLTRAKYEIDISQITQGTYPRDIFFGADGQSVVLIKMNGRIYNIKIKK